MSNLVSIYGSHNSSISLSINGEIKEVVEIERLVGKKNASLFFYPVTMVKNPEKILKWIHEYFQKKYNIKDYDFCYYDMVDLEITKKIFLAKEYIQTTHHVNHANGSLYQSPHKEALILSFDGGGNDGWFVLFHAKRGQAPIQLLNKPVNFGVCYSMVGHYLSELKHEHDFLTGNLVYAGKLMGLAGYGNVRREWLAEFDKWYKLPTGVDHINLIKDTFNNLNIQLENDLVSEQDSRDLAATNQYALEQNVLEIIQPYLDNYPNLPLHITGGGGLNILLNTLLSNNREVFVAPNPSDCGLTVGMLAGHIMPSNTIDVTYAGLDVLDKDLLVNYLEDFSNVTENINSLVRDLSNGKIVGVVRNGSEHGPRALGNRSILCNPTVEGMKDILNAKVKNREYYRPFAPVVRLEDVNKYFEWEGESRWMSFCPRVKREWAEKLKAITHVDGTARVQTVTREQNEWLYDLLTEFEKITGVGVLLNTSFNIDGKPILNTYSDAIHVFNNTELDGLYLQNIYVSKYPIIEHKDVSENLTVVTGLWDINRPNRNFEQYIEQFNKLLEIPNNMIIYIESKYEHLVWKKRSRRNTHVIIYELNDIKNMYAPFWDKTQELRTSPNWYNKTGEHGWLKTSPQATLEWYNPIVMSKYSMLHNASIYNPFRSEYMVWVDAGITFTVYEKYFTDHKAFDKMIDFMQPFFFLSYPYEAVDEIHGFDYQAMNRYAKSKVKYVCRGGLFGGKIETIKSGNGTYWHLLNNTLNSGYMGTEECIFTIMSYLEPEIYRRYELDSNGLIVKFVEELIHDKASLAEVPANRLKLIPRNYNKTTDKTSLYVLGFNFPEQFETLLKSFEQHPEFIERPEKFLINNSTDRSTYDAYNKLCKQYGFEHIETGTNLGINRGRYYAAKHFHERDSKYYYFFEDDMCLHEKNVGLSCRNGFKTYVPNLFDVTHEIVAKENLDFLKLSYTEVYMDNNIQVSWYNVPQDIRTELWPEYDQLPITGLDPNTPRAKFDRIEMHNGISYAIGQVYYANWPMLVSREGNYKMFLNTTWANPYEQTWMSYMFQETLKGNLTPGVLLASPINHNRISHYSPDVRREN